MRSYLLRRPFRAIVAFTVVFVSNAALAGVTFPGSSGTGITSGQATRLSDGMVIQLPEQPGFIQASGNSGSGGTGGGIDDGSTPVAELSMTFNASITQDRGPGSAFRVIASVVGRAFFFDPASYSGRISASVLLDTPLVIELSDPAFYTGTQALISTTMGSVFTPNQELPAGFYSILPQGTNLTVRATEAAPVGTLDIYFEGLFVVPSPGTAWTLMTMAPLALRRRRPRA